MSVIEFRPKQPIVKSGRHFSRRTSKNLVRQRMLECLAMSMIGDGLLAVLQPQRHAELWQEGPRWWRAMIAPLADRPMLTRCLGAAGLAAGIWLAARQTPVADAASVRAAW